MDYVWAVIYLIVAILAGVYMLRWPQRKKRAGVLLMDLGQLKGPSSRNSLGAISVIAAAMYAFILGLSSGYNIVVLWTLSLALITLGIYWLRLARSHLELRENGILDFSGLLEWQYIQSYEWRGETSQILALMIKSPPALSAQPRFIQNLLARSLYLFWIRHLLIPLSSTEKIDVDKILAQRISVPPPSS